MLVPLRRLALTSAMTATLLVAGSTVALAAPSASAGELAARQTAADVAIVRSALLPVVTSPAYSSSVVAIGRATGAVRAAGLKSAVLATPTALGAAQWADVRQLVAVLPGARLVADAPGQQPAVDAFNAAVSSGDWQQTLRSFAAALAAPAALAAENRLDVAAPRCFGCGVLGSIGDAVSNTVQAAGDNIVFGAKTVGNGAILVGTGLLIATGAAGCTEQGGPLAAAACATAATAAFRGQIDSTVNAEINDAKQFVSSFSYHLLAVYIDLFTPLVSSETAALICANAASQATQNSPGYEEYLLATYCASIGT
jgi:hypothetical protein